MHSLLMCFLRYYPLSRYGFLHLNCSWSIQWEVFHLLAVSSSVFELFLPPVLLPFLSFSFLFPLLLLLSSLSLPLFWHSKMFQVGKAGDRQTWAGRGWGTSAGVCIQLDACLCSTSSVQAVSTCAVRDRSLVSLQERIPDSTGNYSEWDWSETIDNRLAKTN